MRMSQMKSRMCESDGGKDGRRPRANFVMRWERELKTCLTRFTAIAGVLGAVVSIASIPRAHGAGASSVAESKPAGRIDEGIALYTVPTDDPELKPFSLFQVPTRLERDARGAIVRVSLVLPETLVGHVQSFSLEPTGEKGEEGEKWVGPGVTATCGAAQDAFTCALTFPGVSVDAAAAAKALAASGLPQVALGKTMEIVRRFARDPVGVAVYPNAYSSPER